MAEYHRIHPGVHEPLDRVDVRSPACDAGTAFTRVSPTGRTIEIDVNGWLTVPPDKGKGVPEFRIRGVQRKGSELLISASGCGGAAALMIASLTFDACGLPLSGRVAQVFTLDEERVNAGGMQRIGNLLVVPLEGANIDARVMFLEIGNPFEPRVITGATIFRGEVFARAAAVTSLPDGRLLLGIISEQRRYFGLFGSMPVLDVYLSRTDDISDGFGDPLTVPMPVRGARYVAIVFAGAVVAREDVRVCMIGLRPPRHTDLLQLHIELPRPGTHWPNAGRIVFMAPPVTRRLEFPDVCAPEAAGIDVDEDGELTVFAGPGTPGSNRFRLSVFRPGA